MSKELSAQWKELVQESDTLDKNAENAVKDFPQSVKVALHLPSSVDIHEVGENFIRVSSPVKRTDSEDNSVEKEFTFSIPLDEKVIENAEWNPDGLTLLEIAGKKILNLIRSHYRQSAEMMTEQEKRAQKDKLKSKAQKLNLSKEELLELFE